MQRHPTSHIIREHISGLIPIVKRPENIFTPGADPGFRKGGGTPKLSGENAKINDIHDHWINVRSNVKAVVVKKVTSPSSLATCI